METAEKIILYKDSLSKTNEQAYIPKLSFAYDLAKKETKILALEKERDDFQQKLNKRLSLAALPIAFGLLLVTLLLIKRNRAKAGENLKISALSVATAEEAVLPQRPIEKNSISLSDAKHLHQVSLDDITHIQSFNNYSTFHITGREDLVISKPLKHFDGLLTEKGFFRCHQSYIINLTHVINLNKSEDIVLIKGDSRIPVSNKKKKDLISILKQN